MTEATKMSKESKRQTAQAEPILFPENDMYTLKVAAIGAKMSWEGMGRRVGVWIVLVIILVLQEIHVVSVDLALILIAFAIGMIVVEMLTIVEQSRHVLSIPEEKTEE